MKNLVQCNVPGFCNLYVTKEGKAFKIQSNNTLKELKVGYRTNSKRNGTYIKPTVSVRVGGRKRNSRQTLARLVALAWVPNPDNKNCVCHKDNNPCNNHYKNLYWGTVSENNTQKQTDGRARVYSDRLRLRVYRYKLRHPNTTSRYLAQKFKISKTKARSIVTGKDYVIKKAYFL